MAKGVAERLVWAVDLLDVRPDDRVLEIGCGHGVAVSLVCPKLDGGAIVALDRSPAMIAAARARNQECAAAGRAAFVVGAPDAADLAGQTFDKIFAVNVDLFRARPAPELDAIARLLAPGGVLCLVHQHPAPERTRAVMARTVAALREGGFVIRRQSSKEIAPALAMAVLVELPPRG